MSRFVKRATGIVAVAVVAGLVAAVAAVAYAQNSTELHYTGPHPKSTVMAVPSPAYPARWEYGRFRYTPNETDWSWRSGQERITGDAVTLWRKFDGPQRTVSGDIWYGEMVSVLGQQGWEVTLMRDYDAGSEVWFRRPAR
jgi:hypothetical protein